METPLYLDGSHVVGIDGSNGMRWGRFDTLIVHTIDDNLRQSNLTLFVLLVSCFVLSLFPFLVFVIVIALGLLISLLVFIVIVSISICLSVVESV